MFILITAPNGERLQIGPFASFSNARTFINMTADAEYDGQPMQYETQSEPDLTIENKLPAPKGW